MASLSLPRVLQLKKNSLDAEREQFEKFQTLAIQKAINSVETPVKEKHVRSAIIGTFQEQSAVTFWMVALRLPLQDNRIVAWKFCHVTHKLLREGHPACLDDSQRHIGMIENIGKLWVHLREGYGRLINLYCALLVCKLRFHARNPRFPGHMQLTADELDNIAENDVNNYFQLCVELFDYMDDLLNLQAAVFESLGNARANSMTASGQCRLAALIPCAQDASHIYDCNVRLLFRLHASLPPDTLAGHRERFRQQFKKLSQFYKHASSLQYYRNLLTLPVLPANPPNFLLQSDFGTYVTPVVSIPEPSPDELDAVGALIDTSDTISQVTTPDQLETLETRATPSPQPDPVVERDRLIDHLQNELKRMRSEVSQLVQERGSMLSSLREHCTRLETQLQETKNELEEERQKSEQLVAQTPEIKQKLVEMEERAKVSDEKFQKLKGAYTQLREEHITLIRQKAEVDKLAASLRAVAAQHESAKQALQQQLNDRMKDVELLQQSASSSEEIEAYKSELANLRLELEQSRQKELELETLKASFEALQIEHKTATAEQEEKITTLTSELKEVTESLKAIKQEKECKESELSKVKEELVNVRENTGNEYKKVLEQRDEALKKVTELTQQFEQEKQAQHISLNNLQAEVDSLKIKLTDTAAELANNRKKFDEELRAKDEALNSKLSMKNKEIEETLEKLNALETELTQIKTSHDEVLKEKESEISKLEEKLNEFIQNNVENDSVAQNLLKETEDLNLQLTNILNERNNLEKSLSDKNIEIENLETKIKELMETESIMDIEITELENMKNQEIDELKSLIAEKENQITQIQNEKETLKLTILELETKITTKSDEISVLNSKNNEIKADYENKISEFEMDKKESENKLKVLNDKLLTVSGLKDENIQHFKDLIAEKDQQVINLNVEVNKFKLISERLSEELKEAQAELEISRTELLTLDEETEDIVQRNQSNLLLKNQDLRQLNDEVAKLSKEKTELTNKLEILLKETAIEKQVMEHKIKELEDARMESLSIAEIEKEEIITALNNELRDLKSEYEMIKERHESESGTLKENLKEQESIFAAKIAEKDEIITEMQSKLQEMEVQADEKSKLKEDRDVLSRKIEEMQLLHARLEHTEGKRLTAECELQDLLQHNNVLEADVAALKRKLEEAQREIEKQSTRIVSCAGAAAVKVTEEALAAIERASAQDTNEAAARLAAGAFEELAKCQEVKGHEETIARSAIIAAHNTASLSVYIAEMCNTSTDMELADKLNNQCRSLLTTTRECLESVSRGSCAGTTCAEAVEGARALSAQSAQLYQSGAANSVDDELADMDRAIEQAASQIEEMLAASKAGDSGLKLEVNSKILDACTTLMQAVKMLVQDARKLQQELGDTRTRQKMYRRNPQWSEGLISAAKAVVFAAKLLVSSADEAVGSRGRVEGVIAAAHEVAGSTAQLVAASRARAPPASPALAKLATASRSVTSATGALVAAVRAASSLLNEQEVLDTSALTLTATRRLEMESKVRSLELETALDAERARLAALRKRHYQLAQMEENGGITNGKE